MKTKLRNFIIIGLLGAGSYLSFGFATNYFDVSKNLDIFATLYKELNLYYVDETKPGDLMKTGIDAMLRSLDPYTVYYPESNIEDYRFMTTGQYGGIGALIRTQGEYIVIAEPYEGFAAAKAGLLAGDVILEVDGKSAEGKSTAQMSKILKGTAGTEIKLKVQRRDQEQPMEFAFAREEVKINDVPYYDMVNEDVGYIKLNGFTTSAGRELKDAFVEMRDSLGMKKLILDLRGNGGGLLDQAVDIVNFFVPRGQKVVYTKGKVKEWDRDHVALNAPLDLEMPIVVLINGGSASASEIVSGSIQDLDRGVLIGQKSFGKGLVQQTKDLTYNSKLKITVAKYYIPSGRCIQKLDYSNKDARGRAVEVPDSLIQTFTTKSGREVKDGAGIRPDIKVEQEYLANVTASLMSNNLIFDFATKYRYDHKKIASPRDFHLTTADYEEFKTFVDGKEYEYTTESEEILKKLEKASKEERYFEAFESDFKGLKAKMNENKSRDIVTFQDEIKEVLENEIISRYYFQSGRYEAALVRDEEVLRAVEILDDKKRYDEILTASKQ